MRGILFALVGMLVFAPSVSAAQEVITARVAGVRHVVVDSRGTIRQIISNTSENVAPIAHLDSFDGKQVAMSDDTMQHYQTLVSQLDMSRAGIVYVRESPLKPLVDALTRVSMLSFKPEL